MVPLFEVWDPQGPKTIFLQSGIFTIHVSRTVSKWRKWRACYLLMGVGFIGLNTYI